jgi:hypothetical protein
VLGGSVRALSSVLLILALSAGFALLRADTAAGATPVCGTLATATWTNIGSPFQLCAAGATIPGGATITIDASAGPVVVEAQGSGGLMVNGMLQTANTTVNGVTFTSVAPSAGSWGGLQFRADTATPPSRGSGLLDNVLIRYATMALDTNSGAANLVVGTKSYGLVVRNSIIQDSSSYGASAWGTPLYFGATAFRNAAPALYGFYANGADVTLASVTVDTADTGIRVEGARGKAVSITNSTVNRAGTYGIRVFNGGRPSSTSVGSLILQGNTVTNSGGATTTKYPAIELPYVLASFGAGQNVDDQNKGADNAINAIAFHGEATANLNWKTAVATTGTAAPLGYVLTGALSMNGNLSFTVPGGGVVKSNAGITMNGGQLIATDATSGGATFTSLNDASAGVNLCGSEYFTVVACAATPGSWDGIFLYSDGLVVPNRASGHFNGATIKFSNWGLYSTSGAASIAVGTRSYGLVVRDSRIVDSSGYGINVTGTPLYVDSTRITNASTFGVYASGGVATIDCSSVTRSGQGVYLGSAGSWVRNSDLYGNAGPSRYDLDNAVVVGAQANWWGQATGPVAGQIRTPANADTTAFATSGAPTATIALSASNTSPTGAFGTGTLTVTLTFNRDMNTSLQPTVVLNPGAHPVTGAWQSDKRTWVGTYALSSSTATGGPNTLTVSAARGCVNDATSVMTSTDKTFTADFSKASVTTDPATAITSTNATLNGTGNPSGWATNGFFRYGTTTGAYTQTTAQQTLGAGTAAVPLSAALTTLAPSTTYYFIAVVTTANGETVGAERSFVTAVGPTSKLLVSAPSAATAGAGFNVTVTAQDAAGSTTPAYLGTVRFTSSDSAAMLPASFTFVAADNGTHTFTGVVLKTAGSQSITATDTVTSAITGSASVSVSAAGAATLTVTAPANATAGTSFSVGVTAKDAYNNVATGYTGTVRFTSSDSAAVLPASYAFVAGDNGTHTFGGLSLRTAGSQTITATDSVTVSVTGSATVAVSAAAAIDHLVLAPATATIVSGGSQTYTAKAQDLFNNDKGDVTAGTTFAITPDGACTGATCTATVAGPHTVTGTHTASGKTGTASLSVTVGATTKLTLGGPATATAGAAVSITVTAKDAGSNTTPGYAGTVRFTSSDSAAVLPASYAFVAADNGTRTFSVTLKTAGSQTITATDTLSAPITGTHTLAVSGAAIDHLVLTPASASIASGGSQAYAARAQDLYNNDLGDVTAGTTFALTPDGSCTGAACSAWIAGPHTVAGTHTASAKTSAATLAVNPAAAHHFLVSAPASATAGTAFTVTVTAKDAANNTVAGYTGTAHLTSPDAAAVLPANYTFVAADNGVRTFSVTLNTAGSQTVTATDTVSPSINGAATVNVTAAPTTGRNLQIRGPQIVQQGNAFTVRVVVVDGAGTQLTGYTGSVRFMSTVIGAKLPADYTFTASDRGEHVFTVTLHTLGVQTLIVMDTADSNLTGRKTVTVQAETVDDQRAATTGLRPGETDEDRRQTGSR